MFFPWRFTFRTDSTPEQVIAALCEVTEPAERVLDLYLTIPYDPLSRKEFFGYINPRTFTFQLCKATDSRMFTIYQGRVKSKNGRCHIYVWARPMAFLFVVYPVLLYTLPTVFFRAISHPEEYRAVDWFAVIFLIAIAAIAHIKTVYESRDELMELFPDSDLQ